MGSKVPTDEGGRGLERGENWSTRSAEKKVWSMTPASSDTEIFTPMVSLYAMAALCVCCPGGIAVQMDVSLASHAV
jgi:hypothetical protein